MIRRYVRPHRNLHDAWTGKHLSVLRHALIWRPQHVRLALSNDFAFLLHGQSRDPSPELQGEGLGPPQPTRVSSKRVLDTRCHSVHPWGASRTWPASECRGPERSRRLRPTAFLGTERALAGPQGQCRSVRVQGRGPSFFCLRYYRARSALLSNDFGVQLRAPSRSLAYGAQRHSMTPKRVRVSCNPGLDRVAVCESISKHRVTTRGSLQPTPGSRLLLELLLRWSLFGRRSDTLRLAGRLHPTAE